MTAHYSSEHGLCDVLSGHLVGIRQRNVWIRMHKAKKNAGTSCYKEQHIRKCSGNYCCSDGGCSRLLHMHGGFRGMLHLKVQGESCSSDSDCYQGTMCAGGVCCTSEPIGEGMANCTAGSYSTEYMGIRQQTDCVECAAGTQLTAHSMAHGRCDDICDTSLEYESGMDGLECTPKKNAGTGAPTTSSAAPDFAPKIITVATATRRRLTKAESAALSAHRAAEPVQRAAQLQPPIRSMPERHLAEASPAANHPRATTRAPKNNSKPETTTL